jgi:DNA polymerase III subunit delta'
VNGSTASAPTTPPVPVFAASGVVGQDRALRLLAGAIPAPVHAYQFTGPAGTGKQTAALAFGAALVCSSGGCGECRDCRLAIAGEHPDVKLIERVGASILKDQAVEIIRLASLAPVEGRRKVMVLDEFHLLTADAAARLLKTIEEPPASTVFVVISDDTPPELITISSRCVQVEFRPIADDVVLATLLAEGVGEAAAHEATIAAHGNIDRARLLATDPGAAHRRERFSAVPSGLDGTGAAVAKLVEELLALIAEAAAPLTTRQDAEVVALDERVKLAGERGSGRKTLEDRHKREQRRHRTDELVSGLAAIASTYRDRLVASPDHADAARYATAVDEIHKVIETFERNPNELLQLQALFLRLPAA